MYRPRLQIPDAYYHVGARGNDKQAIFLDDNDRRLFIRLLDRAARRHGWRIYAYCLMTNHYHVVLRLSEQGLSRGMCELNGGYAISFNARHGRSNHVFGRRFWDRHIDSENSLLETCRYVVLNPIRAGLEPELGRWPWSSYRATVGADLAPPFLAVSGLLEHFGATPRDAVEAYKRHVAEGRVQRQPPDEPPPA